MVIKFNPGAAKLRVIKVIKVGLDTSLKEAKDMVDDRKIRCTKEQFTKIKPELEKSGAGEFNIIKS